MKMGNVFGITPPGALVLLILGVGLWGCVAANDGHCDNCALLINLLRLEGYPVDMNMEDLLYMDTDVDIDYIDDMYDLDTDYNYSDQVNLDYPQMSSCDQMRNCACPTASDYQACVALVNQSTEEECRVALGIYPGCLPQPG